MKICPKCQAQVEDDVNFCTSCGEPFNAVVQESGDAALPKVCPNCNATVDHDLNFCTSCGAALAQNTVAQPAPEKKKIKIDFKELWNKYQKFILIGAGVLVALIVLIVVIALMPRSVNVADYMEINVDGYEGYSNFVWDLDEDEFFDAATGGKYTAKLKKSSNSASSSSLSSLMGDLQQASKAYLEYEAARTAITSALDIEIEYPEGKKSTNLTNDDVITFTFTCDEKVAKEYGFKLKKDTYEYTVAELKTASTFDVMKYFDVSFSGIDGAGRAAITSEETEVKVGDITFSINEDSDYVYCSSDEWYSNRTLYISLDNNSGLSSGDEVTLSVNTDAGEFAEYGVILTSTTKKVTVPELDEAAVFDVMEHFDISFSGIEGEGKASIVSEEAEVTVGDITFIINENSSEVVYKMDGWYYSRSFYVEIDKSNKLSTGDVVTLTADISEDYLAADYGVVLKNLTKEAKVSELGAYVTDVTKLTNLYNKGADGSASIADQVKDTIKDQLYTNWGSIVHNNRYRDYKNQYIGDDFKLYKAFMTTPKSTSDSTKNTLWLVYSVTLNDNEIENNTVYYFYASFNNVYADTSGNSNYDFSADQKEGKWYVGSESYDDVHKSIATYNVNVQESTPS